MKEFFAPARHQMTLPNAIANIAGGLIFPAGISAPTLSRRDLSKKYPHLKRRLLDPQLYLATLQGVTCRKACTNLSSYPWFLADGGKSYDSSKQNQSEWKKEAKAQIHKTWKGTYPPPDKIIKSVSSCILFQDQLDCEAIILPAPLTIDMSSDFSLELAWLDTAAEMRKKLAPDRPGYATVALSDTCLRGLDPWKNDLLTIIIDQLTAREFDGAYIVIEQTNEAGYYCTHPNVVAAVLRLVHDLKYGGIRKIVISLFGTAGLLALAAGADAWSVGYYQSARRIRMADFDDHEGRSYPTYYSHALAGEVHLEADLDKINEEGFFEAIEDVTDASEGLVNALHSGENVDSVVAWQYRQANVGSANEHFLTVAARETAMLAGKTKQQCLEHAHAWLKQAESLATDLNTIGGFNPRSALNHQASWLQSFERFIDVTGGD